MKIGVYKPARVPRSMSITTGCVTDELEQLGVECLWFDQPGETPAQAEMAWDPWGGNGYPSALHAGNTSVPLVMTLAGAAQFTLPLRELGVGPLEKLRLLNRRLQLRRRWRRVAPDFARIITISNYARRELLMHLPLIPERVVAIHLGTDARLTELEDEATAASLGEPYFLHLSYYQAKKNVDRLLAAYLSIADEPGVPDLYLVSTKYPGSCAHPKVRLVPEDVTRAQIATYYRGAMAFVFPSLHETFAMPLTEAMLFGLPLVTANSTCCPETAGDAALLVDPTSIDDLARAMLRLAVDSELRRALGERSRERNQVFTWSKTARAYLELFEQVLGAAECSDARK